MGRRTAAVAASLFGALLAVAPAHAAFPGANGRIAFQGSQRLATINSDGGDPQPLIAEGFQFAAPAWSPDGQKLAFVSNREGNFEIYVTNGAGTAVTRLTNHAAEDGAPAWSPDGTKIVFESNRDQPNRQLYVMNADGTGVTRLTNASFLDDASPAWSPDGTRIAFSRTADGGNANIYFIPPGGGPGAPLTNDALDESNPDWSPDGSRIVFQRDTALVRMAADGSGQTPLPLAGGQRPAWAPDGSRIVYDRNLELYSANPDGSGEVQLTIAGSPALVASNPSWQPIPPPAPPPPPPPPPDPGLIDADGDGVVASADCDDANAVIRPGARDKPGDKIDQNCDGRDAAFRILGRSIAGFWATYPGGYTKFTALTVKPARKGDKVKLTCKGSGCKRKSKTVKVRKNARTLSMLKHLGGAELRTGAVVRLRVTRPGTIGRVNTWKIRAPKAPKLVRRCVRPGAKRTSRCPG